jgi:hypothetical protein
MLLRDPLDRRGERPEVVDVLDIGEDCRRHGLGLRSGLTMMRLIEEIADLFVPEHALVHALGDRQPVSLERGNGGLHEMDGGIAHCVRHGMDSSVTLRTRSGLRGANAELAIQ